MVGRLVHTADFQRALATRPRVRSAHFAVHHVSEAVCRSETAAGGAGDPGLSTGLDEILAETVDKSGSAVDARHALGCVVPKRHARRSVTRNLLRRQIRAAMTRYLDRLPGGVWVVRLRAPFVRQQFPSAASEALRVAVRAELDLLFARAAA